jgi:hypothetical protein
MGEGFKKLKPGVETTKMTIEGQPTAFDFFHLS